MSILIAIPCILVVCSFIIYSLKETNISEKGKSEQEAIEIAIERFGTEKELRSIVGQLSRAQKTFAKWVLYLAVTILVLSLIVFGVIWTTEERNTNENSIVASKIFDILQNKEAISEDMKSEIEKLVEGTDQTSKVQIYKLGILKE